VVFVTPGTETQTIAAPAVGRPYRQGGTSRSLPRSGQRRLALSGDPLFQTNAAPCLTTWVPAMTFGGNRWRSSRPLEGLPLLKLGPKGHYRLPTLVQITGAASSPGKVLTRLHLVLESEHRLDLPLTKIVAEELRNSLSVMLGD
jgi:hypothetical protein